jgi:hypothetical protein
MRNLICICLAVGMFACDARTPLGAEAPVPEGTSVEPGVPVEVSARDQEHGHVYVDGIAIPRRERLPDYPSWEEWTRTAGFFQRTLEEPQTGDPDFVYYRGAAAAYQSMFEPLVRDNAGRPVRLGSLVIYRPGMGNVIASPAQIFRMAQYADRVVIAYTNPHYPSYNSLWKVYQIGNVSVPSALQGRIYAIGHPDYLYVSYDQSSDILLEQIDRMHDDADYLGIDVLESRATVIAHSQGPLDVALARERLEEAGFGSTIGRVVSIAGSFRGGAMLATPISETFAGQAEWLAGSQGRLVADTLMPARCQAIFTPARRRLIDLALVGSVTPPVVGRRGNIRTLFEYLVSYLAVSLPGEASDGMVSVSSAAYGREVVRLAKPYDHAGMLEDPAVVDEIARNLD